MRVLVTGFSGFIGSNFLKNAEGFDVIKIDLLTQVVEKINFSDIDIVLHLAALVHQIKGAPEEQYFKVNCVLTYEVSKKAKSQGVRQFVFMSTAKVFGESTTGKPAWNENSECNPVDPYGKSKYEAEKLLLGLQDEHFKVAIVRSPLVYGVGVKANMYNLVKLVNRFSVLPLGGIDNVRSLVYVGNLVALLKHIIQTQASGIYIAGDQHPLSTTQLVQLISKASHKKVFLIKVPRFLLDLAKKIRPFIVDRLFGSLQLDNTNTNQRLNFVPPYSSQEGISEMVEWYNNSKK
jgi:nucleoside-diphosphate-sugar epimerase